MRQSLKGPWKERLKLFLKEVMYYAKNKPHRISRINRVNLWYNIKEGIYSYRYLIIRRMMEKSVRLDEVRWHYSGFFGFFSKKNKGTQLMLVLPKKGGLTKYIHAKTESGKEVVAAMPYYYHSDIAETVESILGEKLRVMGGGYIKLEKKIFSEKKLIVGGRSVTYGYANHERVVEILSKYGLKAEVYKSKNQA